MNHNFKFILRSPRPLVKALDEAAAARGVSRNALVVTIMEQFVCRSRFDHLVLTNPWAARAALENYERDRFEERLLKNARKRVRV